MTKRSRDLLDEARQLPLEERADLAAEILATLDGDTEPDAEAMWAAEIERRARRVLAGETQGEPWEQVRDRLGRNLAN